MDNVTRLLMQGAAGAAGGGLYVDDVFHTEAFVSPNQNADYKVTNNIDNAGEGGFLWYKQRNGSSWNLNWDTVRGSNKYIYTNSSSAESTGELLKSFDSDGYTIKTGTTLVDPARENVLWNFRKASGFFDVVTYTGTGSTRTVAHNLGCVPGLIIIKCTSNAESWIVYHRDVGAAKYLKLNSSDAAGTSSSAWNDTAPTSTHFTVSTAGQSNDNGYTYVAYIFAGGESTADTARSVDFDGSSDYLSIADSSDFALGSGDFTFEAWIKIDALNNSGAGWLTDWNNGALGWFFGTTTTGGVANRFIFGWSDTGSNINTIDSGHTVKADGQFHHYSVTRSGTTLYFFVDGNLIKTNAGVTESFYNPSGAIAVGQNPDVGGSSWLLDGKISNLRLVKGTCLYTTSFRPPTEPLTSITNTVLLCCNNSSVTGSTVTPSTITSVGSPTASTDSPFDDPEGYKFGEGGDQNLIKTGSYLGNGSTTAREIYLGWEPQWILVKCAENTEAWVLFDSMRGIVSGGNDFFVEPNDSGAENTFQNWIELTPTGFKIITGNHQVNQGSKTYIYTCIRRPDGYVGKPAEVGTNVMGFAYGTGSNPTFAPGFPVDFTFLRRPGTTENWTTSARLIQGKYLFTNENSSEASDSNIAFDYNNGFHDASGLSTYLSWSWKRHVGFDVVAYEGNGVGGLGRQILHGMNSAPQMIITKARDVSYEWPVWHTGLSAIGNNLRLNGNYAELSANNNIYGGTGNALPTTDHWTVGSHSLVNANGNKYLALLFASVEGISKVGYYTGTGNNQSVTTGFQPRFILIKRTSYAEDWFIFDSLRGLVSGSPDPYLRPNDTAAQVTTASFFDISSTGFTVTANFTNNANNYIYYAHA
jgi:hypothetical protein